MFTLPERDELADELARDAQTLVLPSKLATAVARARVPPPEILGA
jgi:hypothetical protein